MRRLEAVRPGNEFTSAGSIGSIGAHPWRLPDSGRGTVMDRPNSPTRPTFPWFVRGTLALALCLAVSPVAAQTAPDDGPALPFLGRAEIDAARLAAGLESLDTLDLAATPGAKEVAQPNLDGPVYAILECNGDLYVAGEFTRLWYGTHHEFAGLSHMNNLARWDGEGWRHVGSGTNGPIYAMAKVLDESTDHWHLVIGGDFSVAGGVPAQNLAAWDGERWADNHPNYDLPPVGPVTALFSREDRDTGHLSNRTVFVGDALGQTSLATLEHVREERDFDVQYHLLWLTLSPSVNVGSAIMMIYGEPGHVLVGGYFRDSAGHMPDHVHEHLAHIRADTYPDLELVDPGLSGNVFARCPHACDGDPGDRYVAGEFLSLAWADGEPGDWSPYVAECDLGGCSAVDVDSDRRPNGPVYALVMSGERLYAGGSFTSPDVGLAQLEDGEWSGIGGFGIPEDGVPFTVVYALEIFEDKLVAGGAFPGFLAIRDVVDPVQSDVTGPATPDITAIAPNPSNPQTLIRYHVPAFARAELTILDARGRHVARLVDEVVTAGDHAAPWDGRDDQGRRVASGVYMVRLTSGGNVSSDKIAVLR
jgi:hypothetical protein